MAIAFVNGWLHVDYTVPKEQSLNISGVVSEVSVGKDGKMKLFDSASEYYFAQFFLIEPIY